MTFIPFLKASTSEYFSITLTVFIETPTTVEESNGELTLFAILLKRIIRKISVLVCKKPADTDQYLHCSSHYQQVARKVLFLPCLIEHIPLSPIKITKPMRKASVKVEWISGKHY